jgi:hypothetical protein
LSEFYPELPTSQQRRWAVVLAGKRLGIKPKTFRGYWGKNKRPASAIDDPERFRHYIRWWRATGRNLMRDLGPSGEALHCARKSPGKEDENVTETFRSDPEGSTPSR